MEKKVMTTIQEQIAVMQAFADGKEIEFRSNVDDEYWYDTKEPAWNWCAFTYRVAVPKPRTMTRWFLIDNKGNPTSSYPTKEAAECVKRDIEPFREVVGFQMTEIIEERK